MDQRVVLALEALASLGRDVDSASNLFGLAPARVVRYPFPTLITGSFHSHSSLTPVRSGFYQCDRCVMISSVWSG